VSYAAKLTKCEAEVARLTAELAAMRERCERLRELYDATIDTMSDFEWRTQAEADDKDHRRWNIALTDCKAHNDLTPPKETSDGQ